MSEIDKHYKIDDPQPDRGAERGGSQDRGPLRAAAQAAGRVSERVRGAADDAASWSQDRYRDAADWAGEAYEDASRRATYVRRRSVVRANRGWQSVEHFVDENPVMIGVVGLAAGLLAGALIPGTRRENRYFGRYADDVRDQGLRYVQDVAEEGRHLVEENLGRLQRERSAARPRSDA